MKIHPNDIMVLEIISDVNGIKEQSSHPPSVKNLKQLLHYVHK